MLNQDTESVASEAFDNFISPGKSIENFSDSASSAPEAIVIIPTPGENILIDGEPWFLQAEFIRQGPDLKLVGPDGQEVLILDYFSMDTPPDLISENGALLKGITATHLAGPIAPGQYAQTTLEATAEAIGRVETVEGEIKATHTDGTQSILQLGDPIFEGDVLETGTDSSVGIQFMDDSVFSLGEDGRMVMDEMVYDASGPSGSAAISLLQGGFTFVSGQIAQTSVEAMIITTPTATIGIRGTAGGGNIGVDGTVTVALLPEAGGFAGELTFTNDFGSLTINQAGFAVHTPPGGQPPSQPFQMSPEQMGQVFGKALNAMPNLSSAFDPAMVQGAQTGYNQQVEAVQAAQEAKENLEAAEAEAEAAAQAEADAVAEAEAAAQAAEAAAAEAEAAALVAAAADATQAEIAAAEAAAAEAEAAAAEAAAAEAEAEALAAAAAEAETILAEAEQEVILTQTVVTETSPEGAITTAATDSGVTLEGTTTEEAPPPEGTTEEAPPPPTGEEPTGEEPTGEEPIGEEPLPEEPLPEEPLPEEPLPEEPLPEDELALEGEPEPLTTDPEPTTSEPLPPPPTTTTTTTTTTEPVYTPPPTTSEPAPTTSEPPPPDAPETINNFTADSETRTGNNANTTFIMTSITEMQGATPVPVEVGLGGQDFIYGNGGTDTLQLDSLYNFRGVYDAANNRLFYNDGVTVPADVTDDVIYLNSIEQIEFNARSGETELVTDLTTETTGYGYLLVGTTGIDTLDARPTKFVAGHQIETTTTTNLIGAIIIGGDGADTIYGSDSDDIIYGGAGNDTIYTTAATTFGSGTLNGGDEMYGGTGDDTFIIGDPKELLNSSGTPSFKIDGGGHTNGDTIDLAGTGSYQFANMVTGIEKLIVQQAGVTVIASSSFYSGLTSVTGNTNTTLITNNGNLDLSGLTVPPTNAITLSGTNVNDTIVGSDYADFLFGSGGNDILNGGAGIDAIDGGLGSSDLVDYSKDATTLNSSAVYGTAGVTVDLAAGTATDGYGDADTLTNIESVRGTAYSDSFTGSSGDDTFLGMGGEDWFVASSGNDTYDGGSGNGDIGIEPWGYGDLYYGNFTSGITVNMVAGTTTATGKNDTFTNIAGIRATAFADNITGGAIDEWEGFAGFAGNDIMDGGSGYDELLYHRDTNEGATAGVSVNFLTGLATDGWGNTDTFSNMEAVRGSHFADTFTGSSSFESFRGLAGNDIIDGGSGIYDRVDYSRDAVMQNSAGAYGTAGVTVNLAAGTAIDGFGDTDTLTNIESVRGTAYSDSITGSSGNDTLTGGGGADNFYYSGTPVANLGHDTIMDFSGVTAFGGGTGDADNISINATTVVFTTNIYDEVAWNGTSITGTITNANANIVVLTGGSGTLDDAAAAIAASTFTALNMLFVWHDNATGGSTDLEMAYTDNATGNGTETVLVTFDNTTAANAADLSATDFVNTGP